MREFEPEREDVHGPHREPEAITAAHAAVGSGPVPAPTGGIHARTPLSRSPALDIAAVMHLQRTAGNQGVVQLLASEEEPSPVHEVIGSGGGTPLDEGTRTSMESAFGTSFQDVRVHADERASRSAESVGANAYTVGSDIVFRSGHFDPGTPTGQRTIAHELSHVVQQSQGPVDGTATPGGISVSNPSDRFERAAEHQADAVMASVGSRPSAASAPSGGDAVQREADGEAPAMQRQMPEDQEDEVPAG
jgi:hypothetical protein